MTCNLQKTLVQTDENVKSKWGEVQNQYQRRADLVPNLVATVKGAAAHENKTLTDVINARAKATSIQVNPDNLTPEKIREFQNAQGELSAALGRPTRNCRPTKTSWPCRTSLKERRIV